ncbi:glucokinase [Arachnomyces sp. PD_36]|nr:glucokinase [Arachnomyces sp. PD_36]
MSSSHVVEEARRIAKEFEYPANEVNRAVEEFRRQMDEGLSKEGATLSQIPTYVTAVPDGSEKGIYLAVDLGGTNFRVCSVQLHGDSTFSLTQSKTAIPRELMSSKSSSKDLFSFLAKQVQLFLEEHHTEHFEAHVRRRQVEGSKEEFKEEEIFDLGFTFSFPVNQVGINKGTLIRWTKGFDIAEVVGQDVCALLQDALNDLHLPVRVAALVNDTVGTLMARSYTSPGATRTLIGAIFGTGTNGAYVEKLPRVTKMDTLSGGTEYDKSTGEMVINSEWGSFDNHLSVLPSTVYDQDLDAESVNPGIQMFEKRVSGMFLGEILRRAILSMVKDPSVNLFQSADDGTPTIIPSDSAVYEQWGIDTSFLSIVEADTSEDMNAIKAIMKKDLHIEGVSVEDCEAMKVLVHAIGKRAARLSAVALAAVMISTGKLESEDVVDIGVDGSLVEFYPGFENSIREALREIPQVGQDGEPKVRIGIAKDGSGVGAALIALVARQSEK